MDGDIDWLHYRGNGPMWHDTTSIFEVAKLFANVVGNRARWAVTGSANLALRGFDVCPSDFDILMTRQAADMLADSISNIVTFNFLYAYANTIRSYYSSATLLGVSIEIMADVQVRGIDGLWYDISYWKNSIEMHEIGISYVPLTSLAFERHVHSLIGNSNRVSLIDRVLDRDVA